MVPEHVVDRRAEITKNLRILIDKAKKGETLRDEFGMPIKEAHDLSRDLDFLTVLASKWEKYCRDNNLNPYWDGEI